MDGTRLNETLSKVAAASQQVNGTRVRDLLAVRTYAAARGDPLAAETPPMRRVVRIAIFAGLGVIAAVLGSGLSARFAPTHVGEVPVATVAGFAGTLLGVLYAWLRGIPWEQLVLILQGWSQRIADRFWWLVLGGVSLAVLVYY
jgi:hypothetical protein